MARVVQRRSGPPYLLIVFVFLFLIATTLAVLFYMEGDKSKKMLADVQSERDLLVSNMDRKDDGFQKLMEQARRERSKGSQTATVVAFQRNRIQKLIQEITGEKTTFDSAVKMSATSLDKVKGSRIGLARQVDALLSERADLNNQIKTLSAQIATKDSELADRDQRIIDLIAEQKKTIEQKDKQIAELDAKLKDSEAKHIAAMDSARDAFKKAQEEREKDIARLVQKIEELKREIITKDNIIIKLRKPHKGKSGNVVVLTPDGTVKKVLEDQELCYISLGKNDNVSEGLTFSVYPQSGIPKDGKRKARLIVRRVSPNTAECKIIDQKTREPVVSGDLIANIVFSRKRTNHFVVEGNFDLYGSGRASSAGAEEVKALIRKFGGKVMDQLDIQTDYLVLGSEPDRPRKPKEEDPQPVWKVYREQLKTYDRYKQIEELAKNLNIPVLNTNRFLAMMGAASGAPK